MSAGRGSQGYIAAMAALTFSLLVLLGGCPKDKPTAHGQAVQAKGSPATTSPAKQEAAPAVAQQATQVAEQTTCPVMGGAVNKDIFVEYQGKKVYFCCNACPDVFKADPEKYISKLPQFAK